jgi:hypothetical protein
MQTLGLMDLGAVATAVITSSLVSTGLATLAKSVIQRRVDIDVGTKLEAVRVTHTRAMSDLKADYDRQLEELRGSLAVATAFEQALMADRVTLYRNMSTQLYEMKLALGDPQEAEGRASFSRSMRDLTQLMQTSRFVLQRDDVFKAIHSLKHDADLFQKTASLQASGRRSPSEVASARQALVDSIEATIAFLSGVLSGSGDR